MVKTEILILKMNLLGGMYTYLAQNENAYRGWIERYPSQPNEFDLKQICSNEIEWRTACLLFGALVSTYHIENPNQGFFFIALNSTGRLRRYSPNSGRDPHMQISIYFQRLFQVATIFPKNPPLDTSQTSLPASIFALSQLSCGKLRLKKKPMAINLSGSRLSILNLLQEQFNLTFI